MCVGRIEKVYFAIFFSHAFEFFYQFRYAWQWLTKNPLSWYIYIEKVENEPVSGKKKMNTYLLTVVI